MPLAENFGTGQVFLSLLWFFLFVIWIWLLFTIFADLFRSRDVSGWGKALWAIFVIVLPYLGVLVYLIVRGRGMQARAVESAQAQEAQFRQHVQSAAGTDGRSSSAELARLGELHSQGVLTDAEFEQAKSKILG